MKINKIRLVGASNVDLPIQGADPSGPFVLKSSDGLGPPEVNVFMTETTQEKRIYQGKKAVARQPVLRVGLQPDWNVGQTPEELRSALYGLLTPRYGAMVRLQLLNNEVVVAECVGQISRMEIAVFSKDPEVQITMECDYPYFLATAPVAQQPAKSLVSGQMVFTVDNDGTAPAGFELGLTLSANVGTTLTLADTNTGGQKFIIQGINWVSGDRLYLDTRPGSRRVSRGAGGGALVSVLNYMDAENSDWIHLYGGDNQLTLNASAFNWDGLVNFKHTPAYWGV